MRVALRASTLDLRKRARCLRLVLFDLDPHRRDPATARRRAPARERALRGLARAARLKLLGAATLLVNAHRKVTHDLIVHAHAALKLGYLTARSFDLEEDVYALVASADFV